MMRTYDKKLALPGMVHPQEDDMQHQRHVDRPVKLDAVEHHVAQQHDGYVAPGGSQVTLQQNSGQHQTCFIKLKKPHMNQKNGGLQPKFNKFRLYYVVETKIFIYFILKFSSCKANLYNMDN
ncbi:jg21711 [Pararge aegeria aegeria]|uniref:Jg21711 protein n=1 Tax=Pararge aegeria aegeria TaxID=348720 RepID=A0A8S4QQX4_9NEOP|nr:jg21711 [Pararge aegeria aegeria]